MVGVATEAILPKDFFCFRKLRAKEFVNDNIRFVCIVREVFSRNFIFIVYIG